jgi:TPP-dependent pyruvate/acetoin dehydrogenase alpha subunit
MDGVLLDAQRAGRIMFYMTSWGEEAAVISAAAALDFEGVCEVRAGSASK